MPDTQPLTDEQIAEIEARPSVLNPSLVRLTVAERDALIATVKQLREQLFEEQARNQTQADSIMDAESEITSLQSHLEQLRAELAQSYADNERLALVLQGIEERETTKQGPETQPRAGNPWTGNEP